MAKQKWSQALKMALEEMTKSKTSNVAQIIYNNIDREITQFEVIVMRDKTTNSRCVEIHTENNFFAAVYNPVKNKFYFTEQIVNKITAKYCFYSLAFCFMWDTTNNVYSVNKEKDLENILLNLKDETNLTPWENLNFTTEIPFAKHLTLMYCIKDGQIKNDNIVKPHKFRYEESDIKQNAQNDYRIRKGNYNSFEKERMKNNSLTKGYIPTAEDELYVQRIYNSIKKEGYAPSFFFYGPAGTGKSEKGKYFAEKLGLPYSFVCCSAMTNESDLRGKPNKLSTTGPIIKFAKRLVDNFWGRKIDTSDIDGDEITYSLPELVLAAKYGWVLEIQEASLILNAGTLGFLNCVLDNNRVLTLPDGSQIKVHPNTVFIFTTNVDYEGCNPFNLALLSRIGYTKKIEAPSEREQVNRIISVTNYNGPREDVEKVVQCIIELQNIIADNDINQGICDIRSAIDCITDYKNNGGSLRQSAALTFEDKVSLEPGYSEEISLKIDSILGDI